MRSSMTFVRCRSQILVSGTSRNNSYYSVSSRQGLGYFRLFFFKMLVPLDLGVFERLQDLQKFLSTGKLFYLGVVLKGEADSVLNELDKADGIIRASIALLCKHSG